MNMQWLSPHLDGRHGVNPNEVLLSNLAFGTRILAQPSSWDLLGQWQREPQEIADPWLQRAERAFLMLREGERPVPDFVARLGRALERFVEPSAETEAGVELRPEPLLELLARARERYFAECLPQPYQGPVEAVGPLMHRPVRLVEFMFDHCEAFLKADLEPEARDLSLELVRLFFDRPAMKLRYEQQFCTPHTTQRRAARMIEALPAGSRVLVLGDDDLVSLALVEMTDQLEVDVLELDADLVAFLKDKGAGRFRVLEHNLRHGVPDSMRGVYDAVTTDPPYADDGMRFFLECAKASMKPSPDSFLFLTTFPGLLETPEQFWTDLDELGLEIETTREHFSRYIYNNGYRVQHLAALKMLGSPLHPTTELLGFPFLYAHFFECRLRAGEATAKG